ncbi:MAG: 2-oxoacid:acceptor oxidoreductase family protein [bacterium]
MIEIRLHGRGGQGVVTGAELIAIAAFYDGKFSQAFPYFGVERRGAPIEAYARIDENFINLREQVKNPDIVIIQDASLLGTVDVLKGLKENGIILLNTGKNLQEIFKGIGSSLLLNDGYIKIDGKKFKIITIDGASIALKILKKPIVNTAMILKLAKVTGIISASSAEKALRQKFSGELLMKNLELAKEI